MSGLSTGDFHPIYNAPMMGAHEALERSGLPVTISAISVLRTGTIAPGNRLAQFER